MTSSDPLDKGLRTIDQYCLENDVPEIDCAAVRQVHINALHFGSSQNYFAYMDKLNSNDQNKTETLLGPEVGATLALNIPGIEKMTHSERMHAIMAETDKAEEAQEIADEAVYRLNHDKAYRAKIAQIYEQHIKPKI